MAKFHFSLVSPERELYRGAKSTRSTPRAWKAISASWRAMRRS